MEVRTMPEPTRHAVLDGWSEINAIDQGSQADQSADTAVAKLPAKLVEVVQINAPLNQPSWLLIARGEAGKTQALSRLGRAHEEGYPGVIGLTGQLVLFTDPTQAWLESDRLQLVLGENPPWPLVWSEIKFVPNGLGGGGF